MLNSNTKEMQSKANVGTLTVWAILLVSLAATLAYWYVLAGLETASGLSRMWMTLLWVSVAVGLVAEIIKKVTLSTFRNKKIWLAATMVSVLTVLGTYSILNQTRQNDLTKQSDSYQDSRANKKAADFLASQYAYAAGYDLQALEKQLDQVIVDRDNRAIKYNTYLKRKQALEKKIEAKRNYDSATGTSQAATANMASGGSVSSSSNPLLASISSVFNLSENFLTMVFYLFVTILLEVAAFWIGGEVEKIKQHMKLTEAELLDMKNQELFGFSVRDVQRDLFDRVKRSQQDAITAEYEVQQIRKTRKDDESGKQLPAGEVAANVNQKRQEADKSQLQAKQESVKAESRTSKNDVPESAPVAEAKKDNDYHDRNGFSFGFIPNTKNEKPSNNSMMYGSGKTALKSNDSDDNHDKKVSMYKHACNNMDTRPNMHVNNMDKNHDAGAKRNSHPKSKKVRLNKSLKAKKGDSVHCPECGESFVKKTYNHTFCKPICRDNYHNELDDSGKRKEIKTAKLRKRKQRS